MPSIRRHIVQLNRLMLAAWLLLTLMLVYWSVARADWLRARRDNPRFFETELQTQRGSILDINYEPLAWSSDDPQPLRLYSDVPGAAVGYYNFRHGTAGIEQGFDALLSGTDEPAFVQLDRELRHEQRIGRDVRLTINSDWQTTADELMGDHSGALVLFSLNDMALRSAISLPDFDPNVLEESFEALSEDDTAPLLNRVFQARYQPGMVVQPFVLATMLERGAFYIDDTVGSADASVVANGRVVSCLEEMETVEPWNRVLQAACPRPMQQFAGQLTPSELTTLFGNYGFYTDPTLPFEAPQAEIAPIEDVAAGLIGQDQLTVTPYQVALAWAGLAHDGELRPVRFVASVTDRAGEWIPQFPFAPAERMVESDAAATVLSELPRHDGVIEHRALALANREGDKNSWYLALAPAAEPRFALVITLEDADINDAEAIGREFLASILRQ